MTVRNAAPGERALATLMELMTHAEEPKIRLEAAKLLLERKKADAPDATAKDDIDMDELMNLVRQLLDDLAAQKRA